MNEKEIRLLKWESDKLISLGDSLYLRLRKNSKTYVIRRREIVRGKTKWNVITLGKHPALTLREAKKQAINLKLQEDVSNRTVEQLIDKYWVEVAEIESKVPKQVEGYLSHIKAEIGGTKVINADRSLLVNFIQRYSSERGARSADRVRGYLKQVFAYALELGWLKDSSPMDGVTKRVTGYKAIERKRTLSETEIKMVWNWKNPRAGWQKTEENKKLIQFLLLTGLRISEAQNGYQDGDLFRIDDTKGKHSKDEKRPHWVYLTDTAKSLLPLPKTTNTNIQAWLRRQLEKEGVEDRFTPHDCRRTFSTIANECKIMPHVVEKCLNHVMEGVMSVYNHAEYKDERIEAYKAVEQYLVNIVQQD